MIRLSGYLFLLVLLVGCSNLAEQVTTEGEWYIVEMSHRGREVYPETVYAGLGAVNFDELEKMVFDLEDSSIIVPGFNSEEIKLKFNIESNKLIISYDSSTLDNYKTQYNDKEYADLTLRDALEKKKERDQQIHDLDSIKNYIIETHGSKSTQYNRSIKIYTGTYTIIPENMEGLLVLESDQTKILIADWDAAFMINLENMIEESQSQDP
ncbi:MAG: hypothetical protein AAFX87_23790 [Bacteroidota bacterium]